MTSDDNNDRLDGVRSQLVSAAGEIRLGPMSHLPLLLRELGVPSDQVFFRAGIAPELFARPDNRIEYHRLCELLHISEKLSHRDDIGVLTGARFNLEDFGQLGELMRHSPTVGKALRRLNMHLHFYDRAAFPVMFKTGPAGMFLGYSPQRLDLAGSAQAQNAAIAIAARIMRELCGPAWRASSVQFSHSRPHCLPSFRKVFATNLKFDAGISGLHFAASCLDQSIPGADTVMFHRLDEAERRNQAEAPMSMTEQVQGVLQQLIPEGVTASSSVARHFGLAERTLRQRLHREGTTMHELLRATRFELARHLLHDTALSMTQISGALCYADAAVFSRAFRSWSGLSPRQWRAQRVSGVSPGS